MGQNRSNAIKAVSKNTTPRAAFDETFRVVLRDARRAM
jgi:hypothetical protein